MLHRRTRMFHISQCRIRKTSTSFYRFWSSWMTQSQMTSRIPPQPREELLAFSSSTPGWGTMQQPHISHISYILPVFLLSLVVPHYPHQRKAEAVQCHSLLLWYCCQSSRQLLGVSGISYWYTLAALNQKAAILAGQLMTNGWPMATNMAPMRTQ